LRQNQNVFWVKSGIPLRASNGVFYNNFEASKTGNKIEEIKKEFQSEGLPFMWWATPSSRPQNLGDNLEKQGFKLFAHQPGMALQLNDLGDKFPISKNLEIKKIENENELTDWIPVAFQSFGMDLSCKEMCRELFNNNRLDKSYFYYIGYLKGKPVTVSLLFPGAGVTGIYWVGTLADARKQGAGEAITFKALLEAKKMGYKLATLKASGLGFPIYKKFGFMEYCKMKFYS
jgi:predicted GNAT family acetyltransferase